MEAAERDWPHSIERGEPFVEIALGERARKKDASVGTNNQKEPPVIISCQSDSFLVHPCGFSPLECAHVMRPTNDPRGSESVSLELSIPAPE